MIIFLLLVVAVGIGLFFLLKLVWNSFISLDNQLAIAIVTASATALVGTITVIIGKNLETKRVIEQQHRVKKVEIYGYFVDKMFEMIKKSKKKNSDSNLSQDELGEFSEKFNKDLILWGGRNVIKEYGKFRDLGKKPIENKISIVFKFEDVLYSIRKDLGHNNINLLKGDLLKLFLTDIDKYLSA
jgi:transcription elongation factor Elf1